MIGTRIGGEYEVKRLLGEGTFGSVYACDDVNLSREVAVKVLRRQADDPSEQARFLREAKSLASINHPNVIQVYRCGVHESTPFIAMELLSGQPFTQLLKHEIDAETGLEMMRQVASGLKAIHTAGFVHRDLSSNNVMTTDDGVVKILDLGLAKNLNVLSTLSREGHLVGTVAYLAPEQIERSEIGTAADVFAFGILLYELLSGSHPFRADHYMSMLYAIAHRDPTPLDQMMNSVPVQLVTLADRCLVKDPGRRLSNIADAERVLADALAADAASEVIRGAPPASPTRVGRSQNPYLNRTMLRKSEDFYGRKNELSRIFARLNATPPGSISIVGDRKIGKSSLLNYVYMRENRRKFLDDPDHMIAVFLDLQERRSVSRDEFVRLIIEMTALELRGRVDLDGCTSDLPGLKEMVRRVHDRGYRVAVLLDEFDVVTSNPAFDVELFSFLRFLANHFNLAYVTSSAKHLQTMCHGKEIADSPFFNIFSTMRLRGFHREEAEALVCEPSARAGMPLKRYADELLDFSGLFPFYVQIACSHAVDVMTESGEEELDIDEVKRRFFEEATLHFRYVFSGFDADEQSVIHRVCTGREVPDALKHVLEELERRELVRSDANGTRAFSDLFQRFVEAERATRRPSLLQRLLGR